MIVGGRGFIGRHLCTHLSQAGYEVCATSRKPPPQDTPAGIEYRRLDLLEASLAAADFEGIDAVVYLAARSHVLDETEAQPLAAYRRINVDAALTLAHSAASAGVRRFLYVSSIGVNGVSGSSAFSETDTPDPREAYAVSKLEAERELTGQCRRDAIELVILRPVLVYGAGAPGNFARLLRAVRAGLPLPLAGIDNRRSLLAVDNLVDLLELCLYHPAAAGEVFLAADGEDVSTPELLRRIGIAIGRPARLFRLPDGVLSLLARLVGKSAELERIRGSLTVDIGKARQRLGWEPPLSMREALGKLPPEN